MYDTDALILYSFLKINVVVTDSSRASDSFLNTVRNIGGRIFPYRISDRKGGSPSNSFLAFSSFGYTYKVSTIQHSLLLKLYVFI